MTIRTPSELAALIDTVRNETVAGANTRTRVASLLDDLRDSSVGRATVAGVRAAGAARAESYLVSINGALVPFVWDSMSTATDDGVTAIQVAGVTTGRYRARELPTSRSSGARFWDDLSVAPIGVYDARFGVTSTGGLVDAVADQSGCGSNATQTSTLRPTLTAAGWSDGGPCITFGGAHYLACDGMVGKLGANQPRTVVALVRMAVWGGANCIYNVAGSDNTVIYAGYAGYASLFDGGWNNSPDTVLNTTAEDKLVVWVHGNGAGVSSVWVDGKQYTYVADAMSGTPATAVHATIGAHLANGSYAPSQYITAAMRHLSIYSGLAGVSDIREIYRRLLGTHHLRIVCDGNSLTTDRTGGGQGCYTIPLQAKLGAAALGYCRVYNLGVGGQTTEGMITRYPTYAAPLFSSGSDCVYVAWELSNHLLAVASASDNQAQAVARCAAVVQRFWDLCDMARATGFSVVVVTATYREATGYMLAGGGYLASKAIGDACIDELNRLLRLGWSSHAQGIADVCAHPMFANSAHTSNTALYPDGTHFSQTAHDVVSGIVATAVRAQLDTLAQIR